MKKTWVPYPICPYCQEPVRNGQPHHASCQGKALAAMLVENARRLLRKDSARGGE